MTVIYSDKPLEKRLPYDFYETPTHLAYAALSNLPDPKGRLIQNIKLVHDLGAGSGNWGTALRMLMGVRAKLVGVDITGAPKGRSASSYTRWIQTDYLDNAYFEHIPPKFRHPNLIMSNPPFRHAEAFIRRGWQELAEGGWMVFLLRLAFLESKRRVTGLWRELPPYKVSVLAERIPWGNHPKGEQGKSDDTAFALYYFHKSPAVSAGITSVTAGYVTPMGGTRLEWLSWKSS